VSEVRIKIRIEAPVEKVWETIMDPNRFGEWVTIHRSVRNISGNPQAEGATMDQVMHMRGINFKVHWTLEHVSPPKRAEWDGRGPAHSTARITYKLAPDGDDATMFEYTNEFKTPGGRLGSVASGMIVGDASDREAHKSLERLKQLLERG
jgi:uncharacterized protein YndB with AHSA1/START domain